MNQAQLPRIRRGCPSSGGNDMEMLFICLVTDLGTKGSIQVRAHVQRYVDRDYRSRWRQAVAFRLQLYLRSDTIKRSWYSRVASSTNSG